MKETIYTIPVTDAFTEPGECPLCQLETRFENECVEYFLGPSLMEPEHRQETNEHGFCAHHFQQLYDARSNRLGLGLILDTYLLEQNKKLAKLTGCRTDEPKADERKSFLRNKKEGKSGKDGGKNTEALLHYLAEQETSCCICSKLEYTMGRYVEVILQLYFSEQDFRSRFQDGPGFCLPHWKALLQGSKKHLGSGKQAEFNEALAQLQMKNLGRLEQEVEWFTKKFDYRNAEASWGTSKDALPRAIQKVTGSRKEIK